VAGKNGGHDVQSRGWAKGGDGTYEHDIAIERGEFLAEGDFCARKKMLRTVGVQSSIAVLTSVQCLSCTKHVTTFLRLHSANFDDSFDPPSSGA
jgi:hypothetical protein